MVSLTSEPELREIVLMSRQPTRKVWGVRTHVKVADYHIGKRTYEYAVELARKFAQHMYMRWIANELPQVEFKMVELTSHRGLTRADFGLPPSRPRAKRIKRRVRAKRTRK